MRRVMRDVFDLPAFRPGQEDVVRLVMEGRHTLALMPTGAGKSLCYQLPALLLRGTTVVISPLIALMKDQIEKLDGLGLDARQVNSTLTTTQEREAIAHISGKQSKFVLATPERLTDPDFLEMLSTLTIDLFVIDEAHCVSQWGHDFRPAYLQIRDALAALGVPRVLALTATATPEVVADIERQLGITSFAVVNTGVYRPNLQFDIVRTVNDNAKQQALLTLLAETSGSGIIYTSTIRQTEMITDLLWASGVPVAKYHGRMNKKARTQSQDLFMSSAVKAMVATSAFGMGIDKPDIRFIVHYSMPGSLETYYQEAGRAGRDDLPARCVLLYQLEDRRTQLLLMAGKYPTFDSVLAMYTALERSCGSDDASTGFAALCEAAARVPRKKARVILCLLKELKLVKETRGARFSLLRRGVDAQELEAISREYEERTRTDREKLERLMLFAQSTACRWKLLMEYFEVPAEWDGCGTCDNCRQPPHAVALDQPGTEDEVRRRGRRKPEAMPLEPGVTVETRRHGQGEVTAIRGDTVVVKLASGGVRKFKRAFLRRVSAPQPAVLDSRLKAATTPFFDESRGGRL
jgi:ATP-dependent DNA helicase RecQ